MLHPRFPAPTFSPADEGTGGSPPPAPEPQTFSLEYVRELRGENKGIRLDRDKWKSEVEGLRGAAEKATKDAEARISEATKAANDRIVRAELKAHAMKAGIRDLDALRLADLSQVRLNAEGEVEGADALIAALKETKPYLFADAGTGAATGTTSNPAAAPKPAPGARLARDMTPEEYRAAKAALGLRD